MAIRRNKKDSEDNSLEQFVNSSPDEVTTLSNDKVKKLSSDKMLERESASFRVCRELWIDFDYWCKSNRVSRSDVIEELLLKKIGKKKDDYK